uniref:Uncharacterized protein n=1 Tax=Anguilla anguilla TaxID=7936 RepID=A0A0E9QLN8_ANGAN
MLMCGFGIYQRKSPDSNEMRIDWTLPYSGQHNWQLLATVEPEYNIN